MKNGIVLTFVIAALLAGLLGCEVQKIEPPVSAQASAQPAVLSSSMDGARAVSQVMQSVELFSTSEKVLRNFGEHTIHVMVSDPTVTLTAPVPCADYGEYTYDGSVDDSGRFILTLTYALCREEGFQYDGKLTAVGTASDVSISLGDGSIFRLIDYDSDNYSAITGILSLDGLSFAMTDTSISNGAAYVIEPVGTMSVFDYVTLGSYTVAFSSVTYDCISVTASGTTSTDIIVDGRVRQSWSSGAMSLLATTLGISRQEQSTGGSATGSDLSLSGTMQFDFGTAADGVEGVLTIVTTTPVHADLAAGSTTAGAVVVTGDGTATAQYSGTGAVDVTVTGDTPASFASQYYLNALVAIFGFEQIGPEVMGVAGTASSTKATGSLWPATMTVTALSSGPDLDCYTDVHVNYYAPADLTAIVWYVDWHIDMVNGCSSPPGIPFEEALDVNGDSTCDAGLDINGADVDLTSGGVEHFTATDLPAGYYVVSINNFDCGTSTTNQATIIIGDYLFGTYSCTYSNSSSDGTTPGGWCRLADIQVNADGTANVLAPNVSYNPWHN